MADAFLEDDYEVPKMPSDYMRLEEGMNHFRILTPPIKGWVDFTTKKRFRPTKTAPASSDPNKPVRYFWAMVVWNYTDRRIQVLEIAQMGAIRWIKDLNDQHEWGDPRRYDLKIKRTGTGMKTEYAFTAIPPSPVGQEIAEAFRAKSIDLEALYDGGNPFASNGYTASRSDADIYSAVDAIPSPADRERREREQASADATMQTAGYGGTGTPTDNDPPF